MKTVSKRQLKTREGFVAAKVIVIPVLIILILAMLDVIPLPPHRRVQFENQRHQTAKLLKEIDQPIEQQNPIPNVKTRHELESERLSKMVTEEAFTWNAIMRLRRSFVIQFPELCDAKGEYSSIFEELKGVAKYAYGGEMLLQSQADVLEQIIPILIRLKPEVRQQLGSDKEYRSNAIDMLAFYWLGGIDKTDQDKWVECVSESSGHGELSKIVKIIENVHSLAKSELPDSKARIPLVKINDYKVQVIRKMEEYEAGLKDRIAKDEQSDLTDSLKKELKIIQERIPLIRDFDVKNFTMFYVWRSKDREARVMKQALLDYHGRRFLHTEGVPEQQISTLVEFIR